jgi:hypothetical protein
MSHEGPTDAGRDEARRMLRHLLQGGALFAGLWLIFFAIWSSLPFIRPGHAQMYDEKLAIVEGGRIFRHDASAKLVVFGTSRVLSGFKPQLFRAWSEGRVSGFNLGLPDARHFIDEIATLVARGETPTHIFLTLPWALEAGSSGFDRFSDDAWLMETIFPFRMLIRDGAVFLVRSMSRGGPLAYYRKAQEHLDQMRRDGGYFFIEEQARHEGTRLPDDFRLDSDDPSRPDPRVIVMEGPVFEKLAELQARAGFRTTFVPSYRRVTELAPAPSGVAAAEALRAAGIEVLGPDYWLFPNRLFSDPVHLNPEGADCYTAWLWTVTRSFLLGSPREGRPLPMDDPRLEIEGCLESTSG